MIKNCLISIILFFLITLNPYQAFAQTVADKSTDAAKVTEPLDFSKYNKRLAALYFRLENIKSRLAQLEDTKELTSVQKKRVDTFKANTQKALSSLMENIEKLADSSKTVEANRKATVQEKKILLDNARQIRTLVRTINQNMKSLILELEKAKDKVITSPSDEN